MDSVFLAHQKRDPRHRASWSAIGYLSIGCIAVIMAGLIPAPTSFQLTALDLVSAVAFGSFALHLPIGAKLAVLPQLTVKACVVFAVSVPAFLAPSAIGPVVRAKLIGSSLHQEPSRLGQVPLGPIHPPGPIQELSCDTISSAEVAKLLANANPAVSYFTPKAQSPDGLRTAYVPSTANDSLQIMTEVKDKPVLKVPFNSRVRSVGFTPDGSRLIVIADKSLTVLASATGKIIWSYPDISARSATLSPDASRITVVANNSLLVMDKDTGKELLKISTDSQPVYGNVSPDGRFVIAKLKNGTEQVWTAQGIPCTPAP